MDPYTVLDHVLDRPSPAMTTQQFHQQRTDARCSEIVNKGIAVQDCFSTLCAIEYLKSNNVRADVIERVLLHPDLRRRVPR
jgi:hypothetical protein